jgi:CDP-diacylglycerol--serine O-phosphatidyltransferase
MSKLRFLAPNLVTLASLSLGVLSIMASADGRYMDAGWLILLGVITDKADGILARMLHAESEFGLHFDSFADMLNFGVAPGVLWYSYLSRLPDFMPHIVTVAMALAWIAAAAFRLARFNVVGSDATCARAYFGTPTTVTGCAFTALFLTFMKYGGFALRHEPRLFGHWELPHRVWTACPGIVLFGALLMASTIRVPKLGRAQSRALTVVIFVAVAASCVTGVLRVLPEVVLVSSGSWIVGSMLWSCLSPVARGLQVPSLFVNKGNSAPPTARNS